MIKSIFLLMNDFKNMQADLITFNSPYQIEFKHDSPLKSKPTEIGDFPYTLFSTDPDYKTTDDFFKYPLLSERFFCAIQDLLQDHVTYVSYYEQRPFYTVIPKLLQIDSLAEFMREHSHDDSDLHFFRQSHLSYQASVSDTVHQRILKAKLKGIQFYQKWPQA